MLYRYLSADSFLLLLLTLCKCELARGAPRRSHRKAHQHPQRCTRPRHANTCRCAPSDAPVPSVHAPPKWSHRWPCCTPAWGCQVCDNQRIPARTSAPEWDCKKWGRTWRWWTADSKRTSCLPIDQVEIELGYLLNGLGGGKQMPRTLGGQEFAIVGTEGQRAIAVPD